ncbi:MAG: protein kinase [Planctomycetota bacterium]
MSADGRYDELVAEFVERRELDPALTAERFVAEHPDAGKGLKDALARLAAAESLFPPATGAAPECVDRWRVVGEIGRGGSGRVLRVVDDAQENAPERALKVLPFGTLADDRAVRRMQREGDVLRALDHPGIVRVLDAGEGEHGPWVVMEAVDGTSLAERLERARQESGEAPLALANGDATEDPWRRVARFGVALADAASAAHAAGLMHRDIKPSNVLVTEDDAPVLIDFGLAVIEGSSSLTRTGDLVGTPHYMAPEQARGARADARTDVWGLGAVLYEMCTLRRPVEAVEPLAAIEVLRRERPPRLARRGGVPRPLARVVDRALSFRPERRFTGAGALRDALLAFEEGRAPDVPGPSLVERIDDLVRERRRGVVAALLVAFVAAIALTLLPGGDTVDVDALRHAMVLEWLEGDEDALRSVAAGLEGADRPHEARLALALAGDGPLPTDAPDELVAELARAEAARRDRRTDDALAGFARAAERAGRWSFPAVALGRTARDAGDLERCETEWSAAIRLVPESAALHRRLGKVRRQLGDLDGSIECFRVAARLDADDWRNHAELARALAQSEDSEQQAEGLAIVREAQRLAPRPIRVLQNVEAAILDGQGRATEARAIHRAILADTPDHAPTWFNLGLTLVTDCELAEAREAFERSLALDAEAPGPHLHLARIAAGGGSAALEKCVERGVDLAPHLAHDEVVPHLRAALRIDDGATPALVDEAVQLARRAGRPEELARALDELAASRAIDEATVRWTRAAAGLRSKGR